MNTTFWFQALQGPSPCWGPGNWTRPPRHPGIWPTGANAWFCSSRHGEPCDSSEKNKMWLVEMWSSSRKQTGGENPTVYRQIHFLKLSYVKIKQKKDQKPLSHLDIIRLPHIYWDRSCRQQSVLIMWHLSINSSRSIYRLMDGWL